MPERERHGGPAFQIAAKEAIRWYAEIEGGLRGIFDDGGPVFLGQREDTEDPTDARFTLVPMDVIADRADRRPNAHGGFELDFQRHL